ncbi:hypothetical protein EDD11_002120 [Mortierella claussenii]|nr:hypothetical protein EDD11_002120 [Mortierella claussenii]
MSNYYDAWSARTRRRSPFRPRTTVSFSTLLAASTASTGSAAPTASSASATAPAQSLASISVPVSSPAFVSTRQSFRAHSLSHIDFSSTPDRRTPEVSSVARGSTSAAASGSATPKRQSPGVWRLSRVLFELPTFTNPDDTSHDTDFDDEHSDDSDDENDENEDEQEESPVSKALRIISDENYRGDAPRLPTTLGSGSIPSGAVKSRVSSHWPEYQPRLLQVEEQAEHNNYIEQLNSQEDPASGSFMHPSSMARSTPALSAAATLQPHNSQSMLVSKTHTDSRPALQSVSPKERGRMGWRVSKRQMAQKRPWSQVIWESPVLGVSQHIQPHSRQGHLCNQLPLHGCEQSMAVCTRPESAYPALAKDVFVSPATTNKSVRINMEGDVISKVSPKGVSSASRFDGVFNVVRSIEMAKTSESASGTERGDFYHCANTVATAGNYELAEQCEYFSRYRHPTYHSTTSPAEQRMRGYYDQGSTIAYNHRFKEYYLCGQLITGIITKYATERAAATKVAMVFEIAPCSSVQTSFIRPGIAINTQPFSSHVREVIYIDITND